MNTMSKRNTFVGTVGGGVVVVLTMDDSLNRALLQIMGVLVSGLLFHDGTGGWIRKVYKT